jgi:hypothetical protein
VEISSATVCATRRFLVVAMIADQGEPFGTSRQSRRSRRHPPAATLMVFLTSFGPDFAI